MAPIRATVEMLAGQAYANAEKVGEWMGKCEALADIIALCGDDCQEACALAVKLGQDMSRAYDTALDLAVNLGKIIRARLAERTGTPDSDPAA